MMQKRMIKRCLQNGAATVELAILLGTILLPLLFGIIEFSFILYDKAMITNASREGARAGIVHPGNTQTGVKLTDAEITAVVNNYCMGNLISFGGSAPATTVTRTNNNSGSPLTVTVTYSYQFLVLPQFVASITGPITLTATTIMRHE